MGRARTRWIFPVVASMAMIAAQSAMAGVVAAPAHAAGPGFSATDSSKVPHYFGPYPNWANSPQTLSDAIVTVTASGPGSGAAAVATVDAKTGGVSSISVTEPGSGYVTPPTVTVTSPGITPTATASAHASISPGVVMSVDVAEAGFGFTAPTVTITGGGLPSTPATATASGGVDSLNLAGGGSGYTIQPIVHFSLPDASYCSNPGVTCTEPTATATMAGGAVTGVVLLTPGSGYAHAPSVDIYDGGLPNLAGPATVTATIDAGRIDITNGGAGYDSVPTVTISDSVAPLDKGATAVAKVAVLGAVTGITVDQPGAGYLTPGLKKFVDTLPGDGSSAANNMGEYIPIAVPDTTTYPGTDYYEIAVVQYRQKFASSLPATLLRGYVQLSTATVPGKAVPLSNANLDPNKADAPLAYKGVDSPHYLGPTIVAQKDRPVRVLFRNLLPTGVAGDLFLPVDTTIMGAGEGPNAMMLEPNGVPMDMVADQGTVTDGVRNPACGQTPKPSSCYSENRATLHLHGGITPWISDGTPHQWTTPAGEATDYPKGVSVTNVPDMPDPGSGAETFFYTNQQSARLLFYHDHSWGITRLNVYAGEAAPYLITDATEQKLIAAGGALDGVDMGTSGLGHSLTIEDKTFVPAAATLAQTDPTWDTSTWGGEGSLWVPHVYMPAQNPGSATGSSPFGRWMYGPWFWPPSSDQKYPPIANPYYDPTCDPDVQPFCEPPQIPSTPNVSVGMEAFNDTPIVNGTAYPTTSVDPKAYRFRILNASNDRFWNLSWFVADPTTGTLTEVALKKAEVAAAQSDPVVQPTVDQALSPKGPDWIQIGNESGFLPAPAVIPAQDITYIMDPTRFDVGNVDQHSLLLAPAERADVVVDFSQFRGKTLILYNDAPAAFPARVPGYDYYTGDPDQTPVGAPATLPGYGPNTRTIMQVNVSSQAPAVAFDRPNTTNDKMGALQAAFAHHADGSGVFESGQHPTIVGQAAYNSAYGTSFVSTGNCSAPVNPSAKCDGFARIDQQGGQSFTFDTLSGNKISIPLQPKALHDEQNAVSFDPYGRAMASIGVEAQGATPLLQNITLFPFVNPATEVLDSSDEPSSLNVTPIQTNADGTQIWKITHNGVDTHPIHWHLYDVQVINRVTWDNIIIPPDPNELGWKDTVRVSPLEDTYVAVRPIVPTIPWGVTDSKRPLNPMMPIGAKGSVAGQVGSAGIEAGFNNTDVNGNPINPIVNEVTNFGWEYVWHCHMLSHEEMDMMRPVTVKVTEAVPLASVLTGGPNGALSWTDPTAVDMSNPNSWTLTGTAKGTAEVGYRIQRADVLAGNRPGPFADVGSALANQTAYTIPGPNASGFYRVVAWNAAGETASNAVQMPFTPPPAGAFVTLAPSRVLDTRISLGAPGPVPAGGTVDVTIAGKGGVPLTGAAAVVLNVTVTDTTAPGYITVYPSGTPRPVASNLNFVAGTTIPNLVTVMIGTDGKVLMANGSVGSVQLVADVAGYYAAGTPTIPGAYVALAPSRLLDTRSGNGAPAGPVAPIVGEVSLQVTGRGGVPVSGVSAVVINATVTDTSAPGYITVYPSGTSKPLASNLNFTAGQTIANLVTVQVGADGKIVLANGSGRSVDLVADVAGYYLDGVATQPGTFVSLAPNRILDTRIGNGAPGPVVANGTVTLGVDGRGGVPTTLVGAVVLNVTVTNPTSSGFITVYPSGTAMPLASNLNYVAGQTVPNLVIVTVGSNGAVSFTNASGGTVDLVADVAGYFNA